MHVRGAFDHVRRRIDMAAGMQSHVHAAYPLPQTAIAVILDDLGLELHVLPESRISPHTELVRIEFEADVDDARRPRQQQRDSRVRGVARGQHFIHRRAPPKQTLKDKRKSRREGVDISCALW